MDFDYLEVLNPEQRLAVEHSGSPLLILAGAGSGKTRVITTKIAYLIQKKNIMPYNILAVTFTKKAAKEMKERAIALESSASFCQIRTFHSFGAWFLRKYAFYAGLEPNFTVYDDDDSLEILKSAFPSLPKKNLNYVMHDISLAKDYCLSPDDKELEVFDSTGYLYPAYKAYEKKLKSTGNVDFGDLIRLPVKIMEENSEIQRQMNYRFKVIMVDEYQDSNVAQFKLLKMLSGNPEETGCYVCVVGDDDQSIYKFRGAEVKNIIQFPDVYKNTQIIRLERNYRSTAKILKTADVIISKNKNRLGKTLVSQRGEGEKPSLTFLRDQNAEAMYCAHLIKNDVYSSSKAKFSDWAILYRTNAQSLSFEKEFMNQKIPYIVVGALKFFQREEVKDLISWLELLSNPGNEVAFKRIINKPARAIGEKTVFNILNDASSYAEENSSNMNLIETLKRLSGTFSKKAEEGVKTFLKLYDSFKKELKISKELKTFFDEESLENQGIENTEDFEKPLSHLILKIANDSGLLEYYTEKDALNSSGKVDNINEFSNSANKCDCSVLGLIQFLDTIELDRAVSENDDEKKDAVTLITMHNTKGLEFNKVVITGMEAGIFPRQDKIGDELEEERRLFYVALTRAKDELYLTSCNFRTYFGKTSQMMVSPFLLDEKNLFVLNGDVPPYFINKSSSDSLKENSRFPEFSEKWKKGVCIFHDDYGYGQIVETDSSSDDYVIRVRFQNGGIKTFMPAFQAKSLQIVKDEYVF